MTTVDRSGPAALAALRTLRNRERALSESKRDLILQARSQGCSWAEVGAALGVSRQAAWELYNAEITALSDAVADRSELAEQAAIELANEELSTIRRTRRSSHPA